MKKKLLLSLLFFASFSIYAQQYVEGFEGEFPPEGWIVTDNGIGMEKTWQRTDFGSPIMDPYEGNYAAYIGKEDVATGTPEDWLITPQFTVEENYQVKFFSKLTQAGDQGSIYHIMITTGDPYDLGSYNQIQQWTELEINPVQTDYTEKIVAIPNNYVGFDVHLAFIMAGDNGDRWLIDNVSIPTGCEAPANIVVENSDPTSLEISWDSDPSITEFEVAVQSVNEPFMGSGIVVQENSYIATELLENEQYLVCVRSLCPDGGTSEWACVGGEQNTLTGVVTYDFDNDTNCEVDDIIPNMPISVSIDGVFSMIIYTTAAGEYTLYNLPSGESTITLEPVYPDFFPNAEPFTINAVFNQETHTINQEICMPYPEQINDLYVTLVPSGLARPGFDCHYNLIVKNNGTTTINNITANVAFNDEKLEYTASAGLLSDNTITFDIGTLEPFTTATYGIEMQAYEPPVNEADDILTFTATLTQTEEDATPDNNTAVLNQTMVNSYDPNDITVHQGAEILEEQIGDYLTYTIRFQNTGSASAVNIRLENELDEKLDWNTFQPVTASHDFYVTRNENELQFYFDDIYLPGEEENEPESHGYVTYRIKPVSTLVLGDIIANSAGIYFDFNPAIVTNIATTEVVAPTANVAGFNKEQAVLYPNPVSDILYIDTKQEITAINVYDINGRLCVTGKENTVNVEELKQGLYFAEVITDSGKQFYKIVKE